jgi:hypothetical protein
VNRTAADDYRMSCRSASICDTNLLLGRINDTPLEDRQHIVIKGFFAGPCRLARAAAVPAHHLLIFRYLTNRGAPWRAEAIGTCGVVSEFPKGDAGIAGLREGGPATTIES